MGSVRRTRSASHCSDTTIVPSSAAMALPTRPAMMIAEMTGVSSRLKLSASTAPICFWSPILVNSFTNWMVNTIPTKAAVSIVTPMVCGPTRAICSFTFFSCTLPFTTLQAVCPPMKKVAMARTRNRGGLHADNHALTEASGPAAAVGSALPFPPPTSSPDTSAPEDEVARSSSACAAVPSPSASPAPPPRSAVRRTRRATCPRRRRTPSRATTMFHLCGL
mmetsp:Transcript_50/g.145  ORF Transcript_50/g.145 Transcript_50/m.145 type:complete len:221 (+) Transcript_50:451-1113(+)